MEDTIHRDSEKFRTLIREIDDAREKLDELQENVKPSLCGERYLTGAGVRAFFHISQRTLQESRDSHIIPYTSVGGKLLYPESEIGYILERNRVPVKE